MFNKTLLISTTFIGSNIKSKFQRNAAYSEEMRFTLEMAYLWI